MPRIDALAGRDAGHAPEVVNRFMVMGVHIAR